MKQAPRRRGADTKSTNPPAFRDPRDPSDPRCSICGNAYGTRFICEACQADPANKGWSEDAEPETPIGHRRVWHPSPAYRAVARALYDNPKASLAELAKVAGCTPKAVRQICRDILEGK